MYLQVENGRDDLKKIQNGSYFHWCSPRGIRVPLKIYKIIQSSKIRITKLVRNKEVKTDVYKGPCQTSTRECLCESCYMLKVVNYFRKKATSQMFDRVLNTTLRNIDKYCGSIRRI